jgi:ubiquinol-cytochrome c reductase cytochrome c1 subunit
MKTSFLVAGTLVVMGLSGCDVPLVPFIASDAHASSSENLPPKQMHWPFDGMTGVVDRQSAQRGFQVYKEVCASCHSLNRVAFRSLQDIGFSEAEVKAIAAEYKVMDGPNDAGDMFERPARPSDRFPVPFANEQAARAANGGAYPPSLDLIVKARKGGADYLYSLLTGYQAAPANVHLGEGMHYNPYFPGSQIAMPQPLADGQVTYQDGTVASLDQMARDLTIFLQWAAEPEMEQRKQMGLRVLMFLGIMTVLMYLAKRRIWRGVKH